MDSSPLSLCVIRSTDRCYLSNLTSKSSSDQSHQLCPSVDSLQCCFARCYERQIYISAVIYEADVVGNGEATD